LPLAISGRLGDAIGIFRFIGDFFFSAAIEPYGEGNQERTPKCVQEARNYRFGVVNLTAYDGRYDKRTNQDTAH